VDLAADQQQYLTDRDDDDRSGDLAEVDDVHRGEEAGPADARDEPEIDHQQDDDDEHGEFALFPSNGERLPQLRARTPCGRGAQRRLPETADGTLCGIAHLKPPPGHSIARVPAMTPVTATDRCGPV